MDWLKVNRERLSQQAAKSAFGYPPDERSSDLDEGDLEEIEQFSKEIRRYLQILYNCLKVGSWDAMDEVRRKSLFPMNRDSWLYVEALKFIKNQKVSQELQYQEARELILFLDYLIGAIPSRF
jgi:hypothetical protein